MGQPDLAVSYYLRDDAHASEVYEVYNMGARSPDAILSALMEMWMAALP